MKVKMEYGLWFKVYGIRWKSLKAKDKKAIVITSVLDDFRYKEKDLARKVGLASMLSVPMMVKKKVIGVINCYTTVVYKFTKSDIDLLSAVANQAAVAIENTELMVKTQIVRGRDCAS